VTTRRQVRVAQSFFDRLDDLLPDDRGTDGEPSATDFLLHDIPPIIDALAEDFDGATLAVGEVEGVRVLITAGVLVPMMAVYVALTDDGAAELIYLDLDT